MVVRAWLKREQPGPRLPACRFAHAGYVPQMPQVICPTLLACPAGVARMSSAISGVLLFDSRMSLRSCGLRAAHAAGDLADVIRLSGRRSPGELRDIQGSFVPFPHVASFMRATRRKWRR